MTDSQQIALLLQLLPIIVLTIFYAVHIFRHGNVDEGANSREVTRDDLKGLKQEMTALRKELGALRNAASLLNCNSGERE